jgi:nucleoside-diphosphate-sugar epimerase
MKILVTGLGGLIGTAVRKQLEGGFELNALNRREVAGIKTFRADLADFDAVRTACEGFDTFFVVSENRWSYRDLTHPRDTLGFEPLDEAQAYRSGAGR